MDFDEDRSRARREDLAENLAMLRHVVLNVLRLDMAVCLGAPARFMQGYGNLPASVHRTYTAIYMVLRSFV